MSSIRQSAGLDAKLHQHNIVTELEEIANITNSHSVTEHLMINNCHQQDNDKLILSANTLILNDPGLI